MSDATRRAVLHGLGAITICFTATELLLLESQARASGKPHLTPKTLENAIPPLSEAQHRAKVLTAIERDPKQFIRDTFYLTDAQRRQLDSIPSSDIDAFKRLVARARDEQMPLRLGGLNKADNGNLSWEASAEKPPGGSSDLKWRMKMGEKDGQLVLTMSDAEHIDDLNLNRISR